MVSVAPQHDELGTVSRFIELASIIVAAGLVIALGFRFLFLTDMLAWWMPIVIFVGICATDFSSGMIHWFADTWGSERMPILGRRLLHPFRVHHVNPDDLLERDFIDTNGDVATVVIPVLLIALLVPIETNVQQSFALFVAVIGITGLPTNQIHQWAHMQNPPFGVKKLQDFGLFLGRRAHLRHHDEPYNVDYCITLGWCNRVLNATRFSLN